jgi:Uma2 family endonuclease
VSLTWPDHLLSLTEWIELPQDTSHRLELVEGVLLVVPRPTALHQRAAARLATMLDDRLPHDLCALVDVEVVVEAGAGGGPATVRAPDVVVVPSALAAQNPARFDAADVVLVVEIESPGTVGTDRVTKAVEYAGAGIDGYWLLDLVQPVTLTALTLVDGEYELVGETTGRIDLLTPVPLTVDVSGLVVR